MEKDYQSLLDQLVNQEIEEIEISREEFMSFREVWIHHPNRTQIVGEAHLGGSVTYRWQAEGDDLTEERE